MYLILNPDSFGVETGGIKPMSSAMEDTLVEIHEHVRESFELQHPAHQILKFNA